MIAMTSTTDVWSRAVGSACDVAHAARGGNEVDDEPAIQKGSASDEAHASRGGSAADAEGAI